MNLHVHKLLLHSVIFIDFFLFLFLFFMFHRQKNLRRHSLSSVISVFLVSPVPFPRLFVCLCAAKSCPGPLSVGVDRPFGKAQAINLRLVHNTRLNRRLLITSFHNRETDFRKNPRCRLFELSSCCTRR